MIQIHSDGPDETLEKDVEEDIKDFDEWFQTLGNDPLVRGEVAILKTYLWRKIKGEKK